MILNIIKKSYEEGKHRGICEDFRNFCEFLLERNEKLTSAGNLGQKTCYAFNAIRNCKDNIEKPNSNMDKYLELQGLFHIVFGYEVLTAQKKKIVKGKHYDDFMSLSDLELYCYIVFNYIEYYYEKFYYKCYDKTVIIEQIFNSFGEGCALLVEESIYFDIDYAKNRAIKCIEHIEGKKYNGRIKEIDKISKEEKTYILDVYICDEEDFEFTLRCSSKSSLEEIHNLILQAVEFEDNERYTFTIKRGLLEREYSLDNKSKYEMRINLAELHLQKGAEFIYELDYWKFCITVREIIDEKCSNDCIEKIEGVPPEQYMYDLDYGFFDVDDEDFEDEDYEDEDYDDEDFEGEDYEDEEYDDEDFEGEDYEDEEYDDEDFDDEDYDYDAYEEDIAERIMDILYGNENLDNVDFDNEEEVFEDVLKRFSELIINPSKKLYEPRYSFGLSYREILDEKDADEINELYRMIYLERSKKNKTAKTIKAKKEQIVDVLLNDEEALLTIIPEVYKNSLAKIVKEGVDLSDTEPLEKFLKLGLCRLDEEEGMVEFSGDFLDMMGNMVKCLQLDQELEKVTINISKILLGYGVVEMDKLYEICIEYNKLDMNRYDYEYFRWLVLTRLRFFGLCFMYYGTDNKTEYVSTYSYEETMSILEERKKYGNSTYPQITDEYIKLIEESVRTEEEWMHHVLDRGVPDEKAFSDLEVIKNEIRTGIVSIEEIIMVYKSYAKKRGYKSTKKDEDILRKMYKTFPKAVYKGKISL